LNDAFSILGDVSTNTNAKSWYVILMSIATLAIWFKIYNFAKLFDDTSPLVKAINGTLGKISYFLILFFIFCMAFGDTYKVISFAEEKSKDM
jgi:hypothetical protein